MALLLSEQGRVPGARMFARERGMSKGRLEAFSDGVIAIVITIMVLELRVPHGDSVEALRPLLPAFFSYVLSFLYVGIYWNNHHHLLHACTAVTGAMLWANLAIQNPARSSALTARRCGTPEIAIVLPHDGDFPPIPLGRQLVDHVQVFPDRVPDFFKRFRLSFWP